MVALGKAASVTKRIDVDGFLGAMVSGIAVPAAIAACQPPRQPVHAIVTFEVLTTVAMVPPSGNEPPPR